MQLDLMARPCRVGGHLHVAFSPFLLFWFLFLDVLFVIGEEGMNKHARKLGWSDVFFVCSRKMIE